MTANQLSQSSFCFCTRTIHPPLFCSLFLLAPPSNTLTVMGIACKQIPFRLCKWSELHSCCCHYTVQQHHLKHVSKDC